MMDALIPPAAVNMLHKRLTGRFRPIVTGTLFLEHHGQKETEIISKNSPRIFIDNYSAVLIPAIEGIIKTGEPKKWETVINITETMLTSWKGRELRGNLCGELNR